MYEERAARLRGPQIFKPLQIIRHKISGLLPEKALPCSALAYPTPDWAVSSGVTTTRMSAPTPESLRTMSS